MKRSSSLRRKTSQTTSTSSSIESKKKSSSSSSEANRKKKKVKPSTLPPVPKGLHISSKIGARPYMEDAHSHHVTDDAVVFGVFDGHGGDNCSSFCAVRVCEAIATHEKLHDNPKTTFVETFLKLDEEYCKEHGDSGAGTFAGDSSAILIRENDKIESLTSNHHGSRVDERKRIEKLGGTVTYDKDDKVYRVDGVLAVTRSLGDAYLKPYVSAHPEYIDVTLGENDVVVVASDGLWDEISPEEIVKAIRTAGVEKGVEDIVARAAKVGDDNVCAIALDVKTMIETHFAN